MEHIVGLGECAISNRPGDIIRTYALSTCVGMTIFNPQNGVMAMAHIVLPDSSGFEDEPKKSMRFADIAVPLLFVRTSIWML